MLSPDNCDTVITLIEFSVTVAWRTSSWTTVHTIVKKTLNNNGPPCTTHRPTYRQPTRWRRRLPVTCTSGSTFGSRLCAGDSVFVEHVAE